MSLQHHDDGMMHASSNPLRKIYSRILVKNVGPPVAVVAVGVCGEVVVVVVVVCGAFAFYMILKLLTSPTILT